MTFKYKVTKICDYTNTSTVTIVAALVYDAQAQIQNNIGCSGQQHAGREQKLVSQMFPNNALFLCLYHPFLLINICYLYQQMHTHTHIYIYSIKLCYKCSYVFRCLCNFFRELIHCLLKL